MTARTRTKARKGKKNAKQHLLDRVPFTTSRSFDFCSRKGLVTETGHEVESWPLVCLKELVDNALDACEEVGVAPKITVNLDTKIGDITVSDNGPGIPPETVAGVLNFDRRVSNREAYVAPDRGAQGNALKTIVAMPFVLNGQSGTVTVRARGVEHVIIMRADQVRQQPAVERQQRKWTGKGTSVIVHLRELSLFNSEVLRSRFLQIAESYTWLNPHLTLDLIADSEGRTFSATDRNWTKWRPCDPTSPHWYQPEHLGRLIGAYVAHDADSRRERTVREFITDFRGLSGTAKQRAVLDSTKLARAKLSDLACNGRLDTKRIGKLLDAMKKHTKPVKAKHLGVIGEDHFRKRFEAVGCELRTFKYRKQFGESDGLPYVMECAFGYVPTLDTVTEVIEDEWGNTHRAKVKRRLLTGVNFSPGIVNPFRELGSVGRSCDAVLESLRVEPDDPVILVLHCTCPRIDFADRGKSSIYLKD